MDLQLKDKVAIVTGASRGIGRAIATLLSAEGMRLVLAARSAELLSEVAAGCPTDTLPLALDLREPEAPASVAARALERFGRIDLVVNNAGATKRGDFFELTEDDWADGFALKFFAGVRLTREAWPHLMSSGGSIVNIVGAGGRTGNADFTIGGSVNAAILNFTKAMADRGVKDGVRVNAINPGAIATERLQTRIKLFAKERGISEAEAARELPGQFRISRFGEPAEIAAMVAFLASRQGAFCQGSIIDVDGGQTRTL